jgi:hypothetical protein
MGGGVSISEVTCDGLKRFILPRSRPSKHEAFILVTIRLPQWFFSKICTKILCVNDALKNGRFLLTVCEELGWQSSLSRFSLIFFVKNSVNHGKLFPFAIYGQTCLVTYNLCEFRCVDIWFMVALVLCVARDRVSSE